MKTVGTVVFSKRSTWLFFPEILLLHNFVFVRVLLNRVEGGSCWRRRIWNTRMVIGNDHRCQ